MMYFGWRPIMSCYGQASPTGTEGQTAASGTTTCGQPWWFWVLLGTALVAGTTERDKRG